MVDFAAHTRRILNRIGEDATVTPAGGEAVAVRGDFTAPYASANLGGFNVGGDRPLFTVMADAVPAIAPGDSLSVRGKAYLIAELHPNPVAGTVQLVLEES